MRNSKLILFSITSSILLSLAWTSWFTGLVLLIAFIPLLYIEQYFYENRDRYGTRKIFLYGSLTFFLWNILSTYWIHNASFVGMVVAIIFNTLLMSAVFWLFHITHRKLGNRFGYFGLIVYWIAFEHIYLNAELSWPWLNLGNGLSKDIGFIQWYEYTGTLGGTLWILLTNILIFKLLNYYLKFKDFRDRAFLVSVLAILIFSPILFSVVTFVTYEEKKNPYEIVVIQPSIDPYNEKFDGLSNEEQLTILLHLADSLVDSSTDYIIGPETAIDDNIWENYIHQNRSIIRVQNFIKMYPRVKFIVGIISHKTYQVGEKPSPTARKFIDTDIFYDVYNAAIQLDITGNFQLYCKSQLVVGVEKMPYPELFHFLEKIILDLGGTTGSYGIQEERTTLDELYGKARLAAVICYESVYGEYVTGYVRNGANLICVITNDGWWGNTGGYRQHLTYSCLRAIETRRSIARSANTGISCFINQKGEILNRTEWWEPDVIKATLNINDRKTFYVRNGDYIGRIADFFALLTIAYTLVSILIKKKKTS
jgi:apolipoprotein N-acyltransferase